MALERLRGRMPLVAFVLLAVICLALVGFACACLTDYPAVAIERALSAIPALPALVQVWTFVAVVAAMTAFVVAGPRMATGRASPALLQRFLF
jgi:hypothetical protein